MATIEVDFDVYKELTMLRPSEDVTYSDVIRSLLPGNARPGASNSQARSGGWHAKFAFFPDGTEFQARYKGKIFTGIVQGNGVDVNGQVYHSPSAAAHSVTHTNLNGWDFWKCKLPGESVWIPISDMRVVPPMVPGP